MEVASAEGDDLHKSLYQWASVPPPDDFLHNFERAAA